MLIIMRHLESFYYVIILTFDSLRCDSVLKSYWPECITPALLALGRQRQEDHEFKTCLNYTESSYLKKERKKEKKDR